MTVNRPRTLAYVGSSGLASLCFVALLFGISANNSEASPLPVGEQIYNILFNLVFYVGLFWLLGLLWSLPFRSVAERVSGSFRIAPRIVYMLAGGLSGLSGISAALWFGSAISDPAPSISWLTYCPMMFGSGLLGGFSYSWFLGRLQTP